MSTFVAREKPYFDFRFADDDDGEEIFATIEKSYAHEIAMDQVFDPNNPFKFRSNVPLYSKTELEEDLVNPRIKWMVLETRPPEEAIVACARVVLDGALRHCTVKLICGTGDSDSDKEERYSTLLKRLEQIVRSHGSDTVSVEVPQYREKEHKWLNKVGYTDRSGQGWPKEKANQVLVPTLLLDFRKTLTAHTCPLTSSSASTSTSTSVSVDMIDMSDLQIVDTDVTSASTSISSASGSGARADGGGNMENLMSTLFSALHAEYKE